MSLVTGKVAAGEGDLMLAGEHAISIAAADAAKPMEIKLRPVIRFYFTVSD